MLKDESCNFDFFYRGVKRNNHINLTEFLEKRKLQTISNLKLPELDGKEAKFRPRKFAEPIDNSAALKYDKVKATREMKIQQKKQDEGDMDAILKHIKTLLLNGEKKLKTISPDLIDQIYRFENLNDFQK